MPRFFSLIPPGHQRGFPGTNLALGATATAGEENVVSQGKGLCLPSLAQLLMSTGCPSLQQGQGRLRARLAPLPAHKPGQTLLGAPQGPCHPLTPLAGFHPCFSSFQHLTKGISGVPGSVALFSQSPAEGWECLGAK